MNNLILLKTTCIKLRTSLYPRFTVQGQDNYCRKNAKTVLPSGEWVQATSIVSHRDGAMRRHARLNPLMRHAVPPAIQKSFIASTLRPKCLIEMEIMTRQAAFQLHQSEKQKNYEMIRFLQTINDFAFFSTVCRIYMTRTIYLLFCGDSVELISLKIS